MTKPMITIHNVETDEIITREMNAAEVAQHKKDVAEIETKAAAEEAKAASKAELLERLGITAEEAKLLLS
jgi:hypothetical protein